VIGRCTRLWISSPGVVVVLALAAMVLGPAKAPAQAPLTWSQNVPGNSKPIILYADDITTWSEKGSRVFLLKGRVWIEHGVVQIEVPQATLWVNEAQKQRSGIYHVDIFPDGEISLHDGPTSFSGTRGHIELNTRGEIHLKAYRGKVAQAPAPADPIFLRAVAMKYNLAAEAAKTAAAAGPVIQPAIASQKGAPAPPAVPAPSTNSLQLSGYLPPPPSTPRPAVNTQPAATLPALPVPANPRPPTPQVQLGLPQ
jgi:hypothetical protein